MAIRKTILTGFRIVGVLLFATIAHAAQPDMRPIFLHNVVMVSAKNAEGERVNGYGFIVARVDDVLWIATASHVVVWPPPRDSDSIAYDNTTYVEFYGAAGRVLIDAPPTYSRNNDIDLAFFPVRSPRPPGRHFDDWRTPVLRLAPPVNEAVQIAGASDHRSIELAVEIGYVRQTLPSRLLVDGLVGKRGQSGAPVMSNAGIVGMHVATGFGGPGETRIIPAALIQSVATSLQVPWQLSSNDAAADETFHHVCVQHLGSEQPPVRIGASSLISVDRSGGCTNMKQGGELAVTSSDFNVRCLPSSVMLVAASTNADVALRCEPSVAGQWQQGLLGGAQVREISERDYEFTGLAYGAYGVISGRLQGAAQWLTFNGETTSRQQVLGSATVTRRQMLLDLTLPDQTHTTITLQRP